MYPIIDSEHCIGCGNCQNVCPAKPNVFEVDEHNSQVVHPEACVGCMECEVNCPTSSIRLLEE